MTRSHKFFTALQNAGVEFFAGVPDSVLQSFTQTLINEENHYICANEGSALAAAAAYNLATGKTGLVYLQNSGLGNLINPLTSLADESIYGCSMLLLIGWRGAPGEKDEPQHLRMGSITSQILELLNVRTFSVKEDDDMPTLIQKTIGLSAKLTQPVALLVKDGYFEKSQATTTNGYPLSAQAVITSLISTADKQDVFLCTTGKIGRLFHSINEEAGEKIRKSFLNVGAMGHLSSVATIFSRFSESRIYVLDGDGSMLMHLGAFVANGFFMQGDLHYIVLNNGCHQSVGGQPSAGFYTSFQAIAKVSGFGNTSQLEAEDQFNRWLENISNTKEFVEIRINTDMPASLPRPSKSFREGKEQLQKELGL